MNKSIRAVCTAQRRLENSPDSAGAGLVVDGVSKSYGEVRALDGMAFEVAPGEMFGFVGGNGAGKTTTMRIIMGVLAAEAGEVRWRGAALTFHRRRRIGYMPEERGLYPRMRVRQQLIHLGELYGLSAAAAARSTDRWLARLGIAERARDEIQRLSLGNQQRVQLAAALVHDPEILVLDEPFSGLDPVAVDVMSEVLAEKCAQGVSVLFSSHQLDLVERLCDRVGVVRGGRLVACGGVTELRSAAGRELVVDAPSAPADWAKGIPGVVRVESVDDRTMLALAEDADDQAVLRAALTVSDVREFRRRHRSLADVYRDLVATEVPAS